ncbi:MAG: hypothetical protein ACYDCL_03470 [Myxococcales bacterium]
MIAALALAFASATAPVETSGWLVPPLRLEAPALVDAAPASASRAAAPPAPKSPAMALALSLALELPTLFLGPSLGHLYAGDWKHFAITGGARAADLILLVLLEKYAFGIGPLVALLNPQHLGASFSGYPLGFTVDLVLVLALVGSGVYDLVDSWFAAERFNARLGPTPAPGPSPAAAAALPPR